MKIEAVAAALLFLLVTVNGAKKYERCELAKKLKNSGLDTYEGYKLGDWVCLVQHESGYRTDAVGKPNPDGSIDYGLFQINSKYWCTDGKVKSHNGCKKDCKDFTNDNIDDDIDCAKRIVRDPQKMDAWAAWKKHCKGKDLSEYTRGCEL
ncbi:lysozyme C, milk isozyme-like [Eublepharis macularius]|uniref:lysozyme n=1 Tax=Eublepharis macularius TaxID=481883 RepID=A0AA97KPX8_EUBMA|nr:lysozyme C, milk isozyme-like [Eublepharis macularius]